MKKILMCIAGLLSGPLMILFTLPFYNWSIVGGLCTMAVVSYVVVKSILEKSDKNKI